MNILDDIPSIPKIPSFAPLHLGITTRVMAKKQEAQKNAFSNKIDKYPHNIPQHLTVKNDIEKVRRSSRYMSGASIPNSVIKGSAERWSKENMPVKRTREKRDEYVASIKKKLKENVPPTESINTFYTANSSYKTDIRSKASTIANNSSIKPSVLTMNKKSSNKKIEEPNEELKEKRKTEPRSTLAPMNEIRQSIYESIKQAIDNSKTPAQLLEAVNINTQKIKDLQSGNLIKPEEPKEQPNNINIKNLKSDPTPVQVPKQESTKIGKAAKGKSKSRSTTLKGDKSMSGTSVKKSSSKRKSDTMAKRTI